MHSEATACCRRSTFQEAERVVSSSFLVQNFISMADSVVMVMGVILEEQLFFSTC